jgi:hypothetical protein
VWRCGLSYLISLMYPGLWAITSCRRVARAAKTRAAIRPLQEQDATDRMLDVDDLETDGLLRRGWRTGHRAASPAAPPRSAPPRAAPPCMRGAACA